MDTYPPLDMGNLEILLLKMREGGAEYLLDEDCPYPSRVVDLLLERVGGDVRGDEVEDLDLEKESTRILTELKEAKGSFGEADHTEAMAYFRTSTAVLEKLIGLKERASNVRQIGVFYGIVMGVMEEFLEPAQITELRERLKGYLA